MILKSYCVFRSFTSWASQHAECILEMNFLFNSYNGIQQILNCNICKNIKLLCFDARSVKMPICNKQGIIIFQIAYLLGHMEVQKHLFRIAQRSNKAQNADVCWTVIFIITLVLGISCISVFAVGELVIKNNAHSLEKCFAQNNFVLKQDEVGLIYRQNIESLVKVINNSTAYKPKDKTEHCSIYKNLNMTQVLEEQQVLLTGLYTLFKMQKDQRQVLKFDNYTIVLNNRSFILQLLYGISSLVTNQIISLADKKQLFKIINSTEIYIKASTVRIHYSVLDDPSFTVFNKIFSMLQILFTYAVASTVTSLYIYVTIISSPAVILLFLKLTPFGRTEGFFEAFKSFPWIGMHSLILRSSTNHIVRGQYIAICSSLIMYFFIMYLGYYTIVLEITNMFFDQPMEGGVGEVLFGYFAIIEFAALVFMRTRPFLKYFPVINTLLIFFFMLYCKFSHFGFKSQAVLAMQFLGISLFAWMVLKLQIPAQKYWQPAEQFVPSIKQTRAGLIPSFNLNWINALPDEWTMLMPLMSRQNFNRKQLSFVDQNYDQLNQYLNQN